MAMPENLGRLCQRGHRQIQIDRPCLLRPPSDAADIQLRANCGLCCFPLLHCWAVSPVERSQGTPGKPEAPASEGPGVGAQSG